jgi:ketosteroid isomerase-like protein
MKRIGFLLCSLFPALVLADPVPKKVENEIASAMQEWSEATVKRDKAALDRLLADDLVYTHSNGLTETKAAFLKAIFDNRSTYAKIHFIESEYRRYGDAVVALVRMDVHAADGGITKLKVAHVWAKAHGAWQMHVRQASRLP